MKKYFSKITVLLIIVSMLFSACGLLAACNFTGNSTDGKSAYQIWLDEGFTGTERDFLNWLKGEAGNDGDDGQDGQNGEDGDDGQDGQNGEDGDDGQDGQNGEDGNDGQDGEDGLSAYEIYKKYYGYEGTELEWLNDLVNGKLARYTVTFNTAGGSVIEAISVKAGEKINRPANPTKYRCVLIGWYKDAEYIDEWDFDADTVTSDIILYAKWRDAELEDLLKFTLNEDGVSYSVSKGTLYLDKDGTGMAEVIDLVIPSEYKGFPVTAISASGFYSNYSGYGPSNIVIPNTVTDIGYYAFGRCGITTITIPNSVVSIDDSVFSNCSALETVIFEDNSRLESIGTLIFHYCTSLISVELPASLSYIGGVNFSFCSPAASVTVNAANPYYKSDRGCIIRKNDNLLVDGGIATEIPDYIKGIGLRGFFGNKALTDIIIPSAVKDISDMAFAGCSGIISVTLSEGVETIGSFAFVLSSKFETLIIPKSIKSIDRTAFSLSPPEALIVFYNGSESDWDKIEIDNILFSNKPRYYYSETQPAESGNYWHFVNDKPQIWK